MFTAFCALTRAASAAQGVVDLQECERGDTRPGADLQKLCSDVAQHLRIWAASQKAMAKAPCRLRHAPSPEELSNHIQEIDSATPASQRTTTTIHGITFENESPRLLSLFERLTTYTGADGSEKQETFNSACKKVVCATEELFGKKQGHQLLYMLDRYGLNGSHLAFASASAWKPAELDDVLVTLNDLPAGVLPFSLNQKLTHFSRGYTLSTYSARNGIVGNASIALFDTWDGLSRPRRQSTLFHELAHMLGEAFNVDESKAWLSLSGWERRMKPVNEEELKSTKPAAFVSEYASTNPAEDFAESMVAYRYDPAHLAAVSPEKYRFIRDTVFGGVEYTSQAACAGKTHRLASLVTEAGDKLKAGENLDAEALATGTSACGYLLYKTLGSAHHYEDFKRCLANAAIAASIAGEMSATNPVAGQAYAYYLQNRELPPGRHAAESRGLFPAVERAAHQLKGALRVSIVQAIQAREKIYRFVSRNPDNANADEYCGKIINEFIWQEVSKTGVASKFEKSAAYRSRDTIARGLNKICVEARQSSEGPGSLNASQLEKALDRHLP